MTVERMRVELEGGPGGPGVCTLYFRDAGAAVPAVLAFVDVWAQACPDDVTFTVPDTGDVLNQETGTLVGVWSGGVAGGFVGDSPDPFIAGSGARVRWLTTGLVDGHRVRGSTFLVPVAAGIFTTAGILGTEWVDNFQDAADALIASTPGNMVVWSRPTADRVGTIHNVVSAQVPLTPTSLRSRRI